MRLMKYNDPNETKQDYGTPQEFIDAVEKRFGVITHDLAAGISNFKHASYYDLKINSMKIPWPKEGINWLNPPYSKRPDSPYSLTDWSRKCREESMKRDVEILFLAPAAVGTNWFLHNVSMCADIFSSMVAYNSMEL